MEYKVEVNEGALNTTWLEHHLNSMEKEGWRLAHIFEQAGNTVLVFVGGS